MKASCNDNNLIKAKRASIRLLEFRERSEREIRDRLKQKEFSKRIIDQTVEYLKDEHLIDDRRFVKQWISSRLRKPFGLRRISRELKSRGIKDSLLQEELLRVRNDYAEEEIVTDLAKKRLGKYKNIDHIKALRRTYGYLIYRGFDIETVRKVVNRL